MEIDVSHKDIFILIMYWGCAVGNKFSQPEPRCDPDDPDVFSEKPNKKFSFYFFLYYSHETHERIIKKSFDLFSKNLCRILKAHRTRDNASRNKRV